MKSLFLLLLLPTMCYSQLTFEVNEPNSETGVFPCMAANPTDWTNVPDLYQNGSWYSDTLVLANDGTPGSACAALNNTINSNIALFHRTGCSLGQSLLNAQNAGANGAIIIDSVDGRPLPFDPDVLSPSITIPFVIISKGKGNSLLQQLANNQNVVVSFGDKTGVNAVDVGIYKEFSLWSRYGIFPFHYYQLPDRNFGTWVYNHGTTEVNNLQVKLWFFHDVAYPQHNMDSISPPFDLSAGDSVFIDFDFEYNFSTNGQAINIQTPLRYGYELIGVSDDDTLDNEISTIIYSEDQLISNTFSRSSIFTDFSEVDYFIEGVADPYDSIAHCLYMPFKYRNTSAVLCDPVIPMVLGIPGAEQAIYLQDVTFVNQGATFGPQNAGGFYYFASQPDSVYTDFSFFVGPPITQDADIAASIQTSGSTKLGFSSDMYHDEQIRQGYLPTYFRKNMVSNDSLYEPQRILTPILSFEMSSHPECIWNVSEVEAPQVSVFPNPAHNEIGISSSETMHRMHILTVLGQSVITLKNINSLSTTVDLKALNSGSYLIEVYYDNGDRQVVRFVKE